MFATNFRPFYREKMDVTFNFLKENITAIIPAGRQLEDFVHNNQNLYNVTHAAIVINGLGVPENFKQLVRLKVGVSDRAYRHLNYVSNLNTKRFLSKGLNIDFEKDSEWFIILYSYFLYNWFNEKDLTYLIVFSKLSFDPITLLFNKETKAWGLINNKKVKDFFDKSKIDFNFNERLALANRILNNFHFRGGNEHFYSSLIFHPFLSNAGTFELISQYISKNDSKSINITAHLLALYMSLENLKILFSNVN